MPIMIKYIVQATLAVHICLILCEATVLAEKPHQPNILYIMIDDLGWKDLHCQGNDSFTTPNIDQLAAEGMRFTDAYAASPVCSPTRAAGATGLHPARLKITQHGEDTWSFYKGKKWGPGKSTGLLEPSVITVAERLKANGYQTAFIGKWHLSGHKYDEACKPYLPENQGFDLNIAGCGMGGPGRKGSFFSPYQIPNIEPGPEGEFLPNRLSAEAVKQFKQYAKSSKPFFMCLWHYVVHWPIEAPAELYKKYSDEEIPPDVQRYQAMVEGMDIAIGNTLNGLKDAGLADNTLVVFTSDNGNLAGFSSAEPLRASKGYLYEGGIRVPLIVRWPGKIKAGSVNHTPVQTMDYAPTFLEAAGIPYMVPGFDGMSLVGELTGRKPLPKRAIYFHYPHYAWHGNNDMGSVIREGNFKLFHKSETDEYELYDLEKDISESNNLITSLPEKAAELKKKLNAWKQEVGATEPRLKKDIPEEELRGKKD
jgi:arylsulfatase A-like enzyme